MGVLLVWSAVALPCASDGRHSNGGRHDRADGMMMADGMVMADGMDSEAVMPSLNGRFAGRTTKYKVPGSTSCRISPSSR